MTLRTYNALLQIFESTLVDQWRTDHYKSALKPTMPLDNFNQAKKHYGKAAMHKQGSIGKCVMLQYFVALEKWFEATKTWIFTGNNKRMYFRRLDVWKGVNHVPLTALVDKALAVADFVIDSIEAQGMATTASVR